MISSHVTTEVKKKINCANEPADAQKYYVCYVCSFVGNVVGF